MAPVRTTKGQKTAAPLGRSPSSRAATAGDSYSNLAGTSKGGGRAAAAQAKKKMAQNARRNDDDEHGEEEEGGDRRADDLEDDPPSSSVDIKKMAERVKAKQSKAANAKRGEFERKARASLDAFRKAAEMAIDEPKLHGDGALRYLKDFSSIDESEAIDLKADFSLVDGEMREIIDDFVFDEMFEADLASAISMLESRPAQFRRLSREALADAKHICNKELEMIKLKTDAQAFVNKYHELMTTALADRSVR